MFRVFVPMLYTVVYYFQKYDLRFQAAKLVSIVMGTSLVYSLTLIIILWVGGWVSSIG